MAVSYTHLDVYKRQIYLHLAAVMDYMSMKQPDQAKAHLLAAWELARLDDLIEGFGEHHGLLGAMLEAVSYTHLDVYKRQQLCATRRSR